MSSPRGSAASPLRRLLDAILALFRRRRESFDLQLKDRANDLYRKEGSEMARMLGVQDIPRMKVVTRQRADFPAATAGTELTLNLQYFKGRKDEGAIVHEFAHVLQRCPRYDEETGWLIEGIADYVRDKLGYSEQWANPHFERGGALKGYQTTAHFLIWLETIRRDGVKELSKRLMKDSYSTESFNEIFGGTLKKLVEDYELQI